VPHADETFYKMKCGWAEDPKVAALARFGAIDACLARDLFSQMIDYSRRELTDGLVPREAVALLAFPLPADEALRIVEYLADPGTFGALCAWHTGSNAHGNAGSIASSNAGSNATGTALRILAYPRWNDTRAEVEARKQKGVKAARTRWEASGLHRDASSNAAGNAGGTAAECSDHTEQEQEQEKTSARPRAGARPREAEASTDDDDRTALEHAVMAFMTGAGHPVNRPQAAALIEMALAGRKPRDPGAYVLATLKKDPAAALRRVATSRQPPPAREVLPDARRPGGPSADVAVRAAEARALLHAATSPAPPLETADDLPDW